MTPRTPGVRSGPPADDDFEPRLKQFRLRQPGELSLDVPARERADLGRPARAWPVRGWLVAASLAASIVGGALLVRERQPLPVVDRPAAGPERVRLAVTRGDLTRALNDAPERLETVLAAESRRLLPDVERDDGTLNRLAGL